MKKIFFCISLALLTGFKAFTQQIEWVATSQNDHFVKQASPVATAAGEHVAEVMIDQPKQTITGFGGCFNELGWRALSYLNEHDRQTVMNELFKPGVGGNFNICRMPVGANDFSLKWYSYNETDNDFGMDNFSISNDLKTLVPFIKNAQQYNPALKLWASPWSPPQWMKYNHHYAEAMFKDNSPYQNGIRSDQTGKPGTDMFIQEDKYFTAYALYFERFIQAYRKQGIRIGMVMPQNEFFSPQVFPSCTWTAKGLEKFMTHLGPQMQKIGVDLFFGTMNGNNLKFADSILKSPAISKYIKGAGFQWSAKAMIGAIHENYPSLTLYQSEQECGNGKNDWPYCRYTWGLIKQYLNNGTNAYMYWNIALPQGGVSHWGWHQNSLVTVDSVLKKYTFNYEYYLFKHISHFVKPGAKALSVSGSFNNMLAFRNPDQSIVLVIQNELDKDQQVSIKIGDKMVSPLLKGDTFNTLLITGVK